MTTKYDYVSTCCNTDYSETRNESQPQVYATCVQCGQGEYTLMAETVLPEAVGLTDFPTIHMINGAPEEIITE